MATTERNNFTQIQPVIDELLPIVRSFTAEESPRPEVEIPCRPSLGMTEY